MKQNENFTCKAKRIKICLNKIFMLNYRRQYKKKSHDKNQLLSKTLDSMKNLLYLKLSKLPI